MRSLQANGHQWQVEYDLLESRGQNYTSPRDNVLFELGLFMGRLGRSRTIILNEQDANLKLPSDLAGITRAVYRSRPGNLAAAVSPACTRVIRTIQSLKFFEGRQAERLDRATTQLEGMSQAISDLIRLMARSRTVELEILQRQFGGLIAPDLLARMQQDLSDLASSLPKDDK